MKKWLLAILVPVIMVVIAWTPARAAERKVYGTAALMVIIEREKGNVVVIDSIKHEELGRVGGLGNLRHASMVFSRDGRYAFVAGRDGNLSKVDLIELKLVAQTKAGENSIGVSISRDNKYVSVCNYQPGGVAIIDADTMKIVKEIPAIIKEMPDGAKIRSRTVGPLDTPENYMVFGLMEGNSVWVVDMNKPDFPVIKKFNDAGEVPYDQLITPDGRYYIVGFLNSDWFGLLDLWKLDEVKKIDMTERRKGLKQYSSWDKVPVYHIPHLESWAISNGMAFLPAIAEKRVVVYDMKDWSVIKSIPVEGTPLFDIVRPGGREVWIDNVGAPGSKEERTVQVIDVETLAVKKTIDVGKGALDPQFTPKGEAVYISVREENRVVVYDADTYKVIKEFSVHKPSGIFCTDRTSKFGL